MQPKGLTAFIYLSAAAASSVLWLSNNQQNGALPHALLYWLLFLAPPLLFVFAYPRFLFASSPPQTKRQRFAAIFHGLGAAIATVVFATLASPSWRNPMRDATSIVFLLVPLVAVPVFLVAAPSLLLRNRSTLATAASFLFWPYWLLLALVFVSRFFDETTFRTVFCFLSFIAAVTFAFAAGALSYRPTLAHITAFAGVFGTPWIYWSTLRGSGFDNVWLFFNLPDNEVGMYPPLYAELIIFSIALIVLAVATAGLRLIPRRWEFRKQPVCGRTWPAFTVSVIFLAIWFSQSVMPYRIPGAMDYAHWPILQILHVEKHGLQFRENCINVWGYRRDPLSVSFSSNHRRLFQYRFQEQHASGKLTDSLAGRIRAMIQSSETAGNSHDTVKPLRAWNVDGWYVAGEGIGLRAFTTDEGAIPPQEIVELFDDLEKIPKNQETQSDRKDVCFGFCYDPLSGLGALYANHRCFNDGRGVVCR